MSETTQPLTIRILTVNTHKGFTFFNRRFILHELRDAVRNVSADVVFLQEVLGTHDKHSNRYTNWPEVSQYEFLADTIWTDFAYGRNAVYPAGHHGNALLSKFPILRYENRDASISGPERRGLLHCVLKGPNDIEIHAIYVHLGLQEGHRRQQLEMLCELIRAEVPDNAPLIIAGDFNDWRMRAGQILKQGAGLEEVFVEAHGRERKTFPARFPLLALDRIYVRNVRIHQPIKLSMRPWSHLSDHAPLAAELTL